MRMLKNSKIWAWLSLSCFALTAHGEHFHWGAAFPVQEWWIYIGTTEGAKDIWDSRSLGKRNDTDYALTRSVNFVRLWYKVNGKWLSVDYCYIRGKELIGFGKQLHMVITK